MQARGATLAPAFEWGAGDTITDAYLSARPGFRRGEARRYAAELWHQVAAVDAALSGPAWQMRVAADAPLPSWLITLTTGHIGSATDVPAPTLFRTAGIGTAWTTTPEGTLELHGRRARGRTARARISRLLHGIERAGGVADADVYVTGDGNPDGVFRAEVHTIFGRFKHLPTPVELATLGDGFVLSRPIRHHQAHTLAWTPAATR